MEPVLNMSSKFRLETFLKTTVLFVRGLGEFSLLLFACCFEERPDGFKQTSMQVL